MWNKKNRIKLRSDRITRVNIIYGDWVKSNRRGKKKKIRTQSASQRKEELQRIENEMAYISTMLLSSYADTGFHRQRRCSSMSSCASVSYRRTAGIMIISCRLAIVLFSVICHVVPGVDGGPRRGGPHSRDYYSDGYDSPNADHGYSEPMDLTVSTAFSSTFWYWISNLKVKNRWLHKPHSIDFLLFRSYASICWSNFESVHQVPIGTV